MMNKNRIDSHAMEFSYNFSYTLTILTPVGELTNELAGSINADGTLLKGISKNPMGEFEFEAARI